MFNEKNILLQQLETISNLRNEALKVQEKMNTYKPLDKYERKIKVPKFPCKTELAIDHKSNNALESARSLYSKEYEPLKPTVSKKHFKEPKFTDEEKKKQVKYSLWRNIGLGVAIFFALGSFSAMDGTMTGALITILVIALGGLGLFFFSRFQLKGIAKVLEERRKKELAEFEAKQKQGKKIFEQNLADYEKAFEKYNSELNKFLEEYSSWRNIYLQHLQEEAEITKQLEKDKVAGIEKIDAEEYQPILIKLAEAMNGVLSNNYLNQVDTLIEYLKSGRADNLKEAIEVYEEELFRKKELQILREQEAQRKYEAKKEKDSQKRCDYCARYYDCSMKYSDGAYNCTAFYPKK